MSAPLDRIQFLAASENRVQVLEYLSETSADREELSEQLGVSRSTLSRILTGLDERSWISQHGSECEITPLGELLVSEFTSLTDTVRTIQKLDGVIEHLPTDEIDVDLTRLGDATITTPTSADPTAPAHRATVLSRDADHIRFLTTGFIPSIAEALWQGIVHGDQTVVAVLTDRSIETILDDPEMTRLTRETIDSSQAEFHRYDGFQPYNMAIMDEEIAVIMVVDDAGNLRAAIETDDGSVRSWVSSTIEEYRLKSEPISADAFPA